MAKRTRRERRLDIDKQQTPSQLFDEADDEVAAEVKTPAAVTVKPAAVAGNGRNVINFAQEYFYVFSEVRSLLIITGILFAVMVGLTFVV